MATTCLSRACLGCAGLGDACVQLLFLSVHASELHAFCYAGPAEQLQPFVAKLASEGVFTRDVDTLGIAYHSPVLEPLTEELGKGANPMALRSPVSECW